MNIGYGRIGFCKVTSTMDNIYIINHHAQDGIRQDDNLYCTFIDFNAAFD